MYWVFGVFGLYIQLYWVFWWYWLSMMRKKQNYSEQQILSRFTFNKQQRKFQLLDPSYGKLLVDLKIGTKLLTQSNTYIWSCQPQQFLYLISTLNLSPALITHTYAQLHSYQYSKTIFYLSMRKRGKFLKLSTPEIYRIYQNVQAYNANTQICRVMVLEADRKLDTIDWVDLGKVCDKVVAIRNRDMVIFDVLS